MQTDRETFTWTNVEAFARADGYSACQAAFWRTEKMNPTCYGERYVYGVEVDPATSTVNARAAKLRAIPDPVGDHVERDNNDRDDDSEKAVVDVAFMREAMQRLNSGQYTTMEVANWAMDVGDKHQIAFVLSQTEAMHAQRNKTEQSVRAKISDSKDSGQRKGSADDTEANKKFFVLKNWQLMRHAAIEGIKDDEVDYARRAAAASNDKRRSGDARLSHWSAGPYRSMRDAVLSRSNTAVYDDEHDKLVQLNSALRQPQQYKLDRNAYPRDHASACLAMFEAGTTMHADSITAIIRETANNYSELNKINRFSRDLFITEYPRRWMINFAQICHYNMAQPLRLQQYATLLDTIYQEMIGMLVTAGMDRAEAKTKAMRLRALAWQGIVMDADQVLSDEIQMASLKLMAELLVINQQNGNTNGGFSGEISISSIQRMREAAQSGDYSGTLYSKMVDSGDLDRVLNGYALSASLRGAATFAMNRGKKRKDGNTANGKRGRGGSGGNGRGDRRRGGSGNDSGDWNRDTFRPDQRPRGGGYDTTTTSMSEPRRARRRTTPNNKDSVCIHGDECYDGDKCLRWHPRDSRRSRSRERADTTSKDRDRRSRKKR